jgi:hypothetical protein
MKVKVKLNYIAPDGVVLSEFDAICKTTSVKGMLDRKATIEFDCHGRMYWVLPNQEKTLSKSTLYLFFNFLATNPESNKYQLTIFNGQLQCIGTTFKNGNSASCPFNFESSIVDGVCIRDMQEEARPYIKLNQSGISGRFASEQVKDEFIKSTSIIEAINVERSLTDVSTSSGIALKDKIIIEYVAIHITSRDDKTLHSEFSMHQPNRHENVRERIQKMTGKKPNELGDVEEGFKTDDDVFLTRREAMDLHRQGRLLNRLDFRYGKADDKDMQSIYLW